MWWGGVWGFVRGEGMGIRQGRDGGSLGCGGRSEVLGWACAGAWWALFVARAGDKRTRVDVQLGIKSYE